MAAKINAELNN